MKKGMVNVLILALSIINLVLTIVIVFTFVPAMNKTTKLVNKICNIVDLNVSSNSDDSEVSLSDLASKNIIFNGDSDITVSLKPTQGDSQHYIKLSVLVNFNTKSKDYSDVSSSFDKSMDYISSIVVDVISSHQYSDADKTKMENEILTKLQSEFKSDCIYSISFSQFILQ